jgi:hypothetical protein
MVGFAACRSDCVRVRCDRDSCAQVYLLFILETLGKLCKNVWRSMAMQGLDPNRIQVRTYYLCKKRKARFSFTELIDTNPCLTCQLMCIFFSNAQRANHLTPHCLINAAPCKPTFSLPHACKGILMSLVASTRQTP